MGRVLNRERKCGPLGNRSEESDVLGLGHVAHRWRLQDGPVGAGLDGGADESDLARNVRFGNRHREWQPSAKVLGRPVEEQAALAQIELVDFRAEPEHRDPVHAGLDAEVHLAAHGAAIEPSVFVEEGVENGIDPANLFCLHRTSPLRIRDRLSQWVPATSRGRTSKCLLALPTDFASSEHQWLVDRRAPQSRIVPWSDMVPLKAV